MFKKIINCYPVNHVVVASAMYCLLHLFLSAFSSSVAVLGIATFREVGQSLHWWPHEDQPWQVAVTDVCHFACGVLLIRLFMG